MLFVRVSSFDCHDVPRGSLLLLSSRYLIPGTSCMFPQHQTSQQHQVHRPHVPQSQKVIDKINSIVNSDQFVKNLSRDITNKNISDSDTNSNPDLQHRSQVYSQHHAQMRPRRRTQTPRPISPRHNPQPESHATQKPNLQDETISDTIPKNDNPEQTAYQFQVIYNKDNLFCHGEGWEAEFLNHTDEKTLNSIRTRLKQSNTTTLNTNNPFTDLYTHLTPQPPKPQAPQNYQTEYNTTPSSPSIQNLLTSTFNESSPPQSSQPIMSPILKTTQDQLQTLQHSTHPHNIQQNLKLH